LIRAREGAVDHVLLDSRDERRQIDAVRREIERRLRFVLRRRLQIRRQIGDFDLRSRADHRQARSIGVLQLTHVARPIERHERRIAPERR
jgi:hypothetical protein